MRQRAMIAMAISLQPRHPDRRRADHGPRRDHPGADHRRDARDAGAARLGRDPHHPRPRRRGRDGRQGDGHVRRAHGRVRPVDEIYYNPHHPYTWGLLRSLPRLDVVEKHAPRRPSRGSRRTCCCSRRAARSSARCAFEREQCRDTWPEREIVGPSTASTAGSRRTSASRRALSLPQLQGAGRVSLLEVERPARSTSRSRRASSSAPRATCTPSTASASRSRRARRWAGRRERLRQVDDRSRDPAPHRADRPAGSTFDGHRRDGRVARASMQRLRRDMQIVFQDPYASLNPRMRVQRHHRRAAAHPRASAPRRERKQRVVRAAREGRAQRRARRALPARVLRRPAPAHRRRPRAGAATRGSSSATSRSAPSTSRSGRRSSTCSRTCRRSSSLTYLFIAHDLSVVKHISDRVAVMYLGKIVEIADSDAALRPPAAPLHRGAALGGARSPIPQTERARRRIILEGDVPSPANPPSGLRLPPALPAGCRRPAPTPCRRSASTGATPATTTRWPATSRRVTRAASARWLETPFEGARCVAATHAATSEPAASDGGADTPR